MTYTYKPRTIDRIKADIVKLRAEIERANEDDRDHAIADMESDLESLFEELEEAHVSHED